MKTTFRYVLVLALAGFVFTGCATHRCCKSQQWEYKKVKVFAQSEQAAEAQLNEMGKDGWKLLNPDPANGYLMFERPKQ